MNKDINKKNLNEVISILKKILKVFYVLLIVVGAFVLLKIIKELKIVGVILQILKILSPLFIGIVVAWLLNPFIKWLESKKIRRGLACAFAYFILIACILLLVKAIIPLLYNQTIELVENFPNIFSNVKEWTTSLFNNVNSSAINVENMEKTMLLKLDEVSSQLSTSLPSIIINVVTSTISYIGTFVVGLVIGFFLLLSCNNLSNTLLELLPKKFRHDTQELGHNINQSLRSYVTGALLDALLVFIVSTLAFALIGLKAPILFGLFCGLMNVIPYAGPYIGGAPAVIVGFSQGTGIGIAVLIAIVIIQSIEGNVLQTLIISKTTKLNPVTIIIGLLIFGHFFGIVGMLLSTPIIGVLKVVVKYFNDKYEIINLKQENL